MLSVFSINSKMSDKIRQLQQCAGSEFERLLFAGPEEEPLYILKPEVIHILQWCNTKILYELPKVKNQRNTYWIGVRLRIASNMLNKCETILTKDVCIMYHSRLTSRVRKILGEIYTEDLPF